MFEQGSKPAYGQLCLLVEMYRLISIAALLSTLFMPEALSCSQTSWDIVSHKGDLRASQGYSENNVAIAYPCWLECATAWLNGIDSECKLILMQEGYYYALKTSISTY